jgi:SAM-dependent methyltransferase
MNANMARVPNVAADTRGLVLRCPVCAASLGRVEFSAAAAIGECQNCGFRVARQGGIWRALAPMRELYYRRFAAEYSAIRAREGRGSETAEYYLALPFRDVTGHNAWQWWIRACSFEYLASRALPPIEARFGRPLDVLDMGAGNGWLSYRLGLRGHACVAVDLLDNHQDGLGAAWHYERQLARPFVCVQAEMDNLPFDDAQFDVAVFNASLHYSEDYVRTLREVIRCLRPGGEVLIVDTPFYDRDESGRAMVLEKHVTFQQQHGFRSDSIRSQEYITPRVLAEMEQACGIRWHIGRPWYGLGWALRPWKAKLKGRREPSRFYIFSATVGGQ